LVIFAFGDFQNTLLQPKKLMPRRSFSIVYCFVKIRPLFYLTENQLLVSHFFNHNSQLVTNDWLDCHMEKVFFLSIEAKVMRNILSWRTIQHLPI